MDQPETASNDETPIEVFVDAELVAAFVRIASAPGSTLRPAHEEAHALFSKGDHTGAALVIAQALRTGNSRNRAYREGHSNAARPAYLLPVVPNDFNVPQPNPREPERNTDA